MCRTADRAVIPTASIHACRWPRRTPQLKHEERDAGGGDEGRRGLGHGDGNEVAEDVEPASQRRGDGRQEVQYSGEGEDGASLSTRSPPARGPA